MKGRLASSDFYNRNAAERGARYSRARFEYIHADILEQLPPPGSDILDVGAGSGRDAAALSARGYRVVAVEPASGLAAWGRKHYADHDIEWVDDALPELFQTKSLQRRYSFILCSAVLMHVPADQLDRSFAVMATLLVPGGRMATSLRDRSARDPAEIFYDHPNEAILGSASRAGFTILSARENPDQLERPELSWRTYLFQKIG